MTVQIVDTVLVNGGIGAVLTDSSGNALGFQAAPAPPQPIPSFSACTTLAEMHKQVAIAAAKATLTGQALKKAVQAADEQYFLDVLACARQFNVISPSAQDGLKAILKQIQQGT